MAVEMRAIIDVASRDGRGWRNRNPGAREPVPQVVQNHWSMSRSLGDLGTVSRAPSGFAWQEYERAFRAAAGGPRAA